VPAGSALGEEIASQPACWRRALGELDRWRGLLPRPGERVAVVGCGTYRRFRDAVTITS
jgi:hypothetical protein